MHIIRALIKRPLKSMPYLSAQNLTKLCQRPILGSEFALSFVLSILLAPSILASFALKQI